MEKRTKVFISYSHRDAKWLSRLRVHFKPLERKCDIDIWDDTRIKPGSNWKQDIANALTEAKVIVLLVSADFLASDFISNIELPILLDDAEKSGTLVLPVILSPSYFLKTAGLSKFQAVNNPSHPLISMSEGEQEEIFVRVAEAIEASYISISKSATEKQNARPCAEDLIPIIPDIRPKVQEQPANSNVRITFQPKVCMLGAFAVGKTSLVQRFVKSIYSDKYLTTVGVKIDKKVIAVGNYNVTMILWDLAGEDEFSALNFSYIKGSRGYILVADGTRPDTLKTAYDIHRRVVRELGEVPFLFIINKADLMDEWEIDDEYRETLENLGWPVLTTSAKTGAGVEEAFLTLTKKMIGLED